MPTIRGSVTSVDRVACVKRTADPEGPREPVSYGPLPERPGLLLRPKIPQPHLVRGCLARDGGPCAEALGGLLRHSVRKPAILSGKDLDPPEGRGLLVRLPREEPGLRGLASRRERRTGR